MLKPTSVSHVYSKGERVDTAFPNPSDPNNGILSIDALLNSQKDSTTLSLSDRFLGDGGANFVAEFLLKHSHFTRVELRGNNLTHIGFIRVCNALQKCQNLFSLHFEWNNITNESNEGLDALLSLVRVAKKLVVIDLRNNCIPSKAAGALAAIIRESKSLQLLDLRWNDIKDEGAQQFIGVLKELNRRFYLALSGNMVNEQILSDINSLNSKEVIQELESGFEQSGLKISGLESPSKGFLANFSSENLNRRVNIGNDDALYNQKASDLQDHSNKLIMSASPAINSQARNLGEHTLVSNADQDRNSPYRFDYMKPFNRTESASKYAQNKIFEPLEMKALYLEGENQPFDHLEVNQQKEFLIKNQALKIDTLIQELKAKTIENEIVNQELKRIKSEYADNFRAIQNQSQDLVYNLTGQLSALRREIEKKSNDHMYEIKQINKNWENKVIDHQDRILDLTRELETKNYDLESLRKSLDTIRHSHADRLKKIEIETREDQVRQQNYALVGLEERYKKLETDKDIYLQRLDKVTVDNQNIEKQLQEERKKFQNERSRFKTDYERLKKELEQALGEVQRLKKESFSKEGGFSQIQKEYQNSQKEIVKLRDTHRQEIDKIKFDHNLEKVKWSDEIKDLNIRLKEAQRQIAELKNNSLLLAGKQYSSRNILDELNTNDTSKRINLNNANDNYRSNVELNRQYPKRFL